MHKIAIDDIEKESNKILHYSFDDEIKELEGCKIEADLDLESVGEYINVYGHVLGSIILECDRCLKKYNYDLDFDIEETYAKHSLFDEYSQEVELQSGQFVTDLNGEKEIDIYDLLYQSVILNLPNKKVCGINCNEELFAQKNDKKVHDTRMDIFKNIKIEKK